MRSLVRGLLLLVWLAGAPAFAAELSRHALVMGNASYPIGTLANARNDATLMADTLESLGFAVTRAFDLSRSRFFDEVAAFAEKLPRDAMAVVYYAGHGMQIQGANYLIPSDMVPTSEQGVAIRGYPVKSLLEKLGSAAGAVNIVILDACRNNPFLQKESRYRAFEGLGLSKVTTPRGTLVAYSTAPGQLAEDGQGRAHSYYTETLARVMVQPGKTIERIFKEVAELVRRKTLDDQQPWFETSLVEDYYFVPQGGVQVVRMQKRMRKFDPAAIAPARPEDDPWFMKLGESEWAAMDAEIERRARQLDAQAVPLLVHRAGSGNLVAQTTLGLAHLGRAQGLATEAKFETDPAQGLRWLRQAAEGGFPMAQAALGELYLEGNGVERNLEAANLWLTRAARADYGRARAALAKLGPASHPVR
jgi:hypothetical protein